MLMKTDPVDVLRTWEMNQPDLIVRLVSSLNGRGIVTDEEHGGLSSSMVEGWSRSCDDFLRTYGYYGAWIQTCVRYSGTHGGVYGLYNPDLKSHAEAEEHVRKIGDAPL
jgi:hypothetical protein